MKVSLVRFFAIACCLIGLLMSYSPASSAQSFSVTGTMTTTREHHTSTLLNDGTVLIAGGENGNGTNSSAEIYNPVTKEFAATETGMTAGRTSHTATLLNDGTVLIAGGYNGDGTHASAEIYDPVAKTFTATAAGMTTARAFQTATLLPNGLVLIAGGENGNGTHAGAELYNPTTRSFAATAGGMSVPRQSHTASLLNTGEVLIAGGYNGNTVYASAELYNPATGTFAVTGTMAHQRKYHTATNLADGTVLVAAGGFNGYLNSAEIYNATNKTFTAAGNLNDAREFHTATLQNDGTVLIVGGYSGSYLSSAEVYHPTTKTFALTGSLNTARGNHTASLLGTDGFVLVAGGYDGTTLASAELFNGPAAEMGIANPLFNIVSIVYDAPGNRSNSGFTNTTTQGTTTTIGSSFMQGDSTTFTIGTDFMGNGGSLSWSFGTATTTGNSSAFTETLTDGTGVANDSGSGNPNAINHVNDLFIIWLNPAVLMTQTSPTSFNYSTGTQLQVAPNPNPGQPESIDQVEVFAQVMLPNAQGVTSIPVSILIPQIVGNQTLPGLAHICAKPTFYPSSCTLANQCGCVPSDFTAILAADPLIKYTPTESPLNANTSTATQCTNPAASAKCRYVPIMSSPTEQVTALLSGPDIAGGNIPVNTFMQSDSTQTAVTLSESEAVTEGFSWDSKFGVPGFSSDLKSQTTMTWTSTESLGETDGSAHTMTVTLSSSTVGCSENINIFEDIVYHTYVFQQPSGTSCP
jgi:Galactose oxidase, central domain/Kelch motif